MEMTDKTKKILIYGGGAASILALVLYVKNRNAARAASGFAPSSGTSGGVSGSGTAGNAADAAAINAATALQVEQSRAQNALAIATLNQQGVLAGYKLQTDAAKSISSNQETAQIFTAVAAGGAGGIGNKAIEAAYNTVKDLISRVFGLATTAQQGVISAAQGSGLEGFMQAGDEGYDQPGSSFISPLEYSWQGQPVGYGTVLAPDYYRGNMGSGDSSWFGISPVYDQSYAGGEAFIGPPAYVDPNVYGEGGA